jgi:hypothetical protein
MDDAKDKMPGLNAGIISLKEKKSPSKMPALATFKVNRVTAKTDLL